MEWKGIDWILSGGESLAVQFIGPFVPNPKQSQFRPVLPFRASSS